MMIRQSKWIYIYNLQVMRRIIWILPCSQQHQVSLHLYWFTLLFNKPSLTHSSISMRLYEVSQDQNQIFIGLPWRLSQWSWLIISNSILPTQQFKLAPFINSHNHHATWACQGWMQKCNCSLRCTSWVSWQESHRSAIAHEHPGRTPPYPQWCSHDFGRTCVSSHFLTLRSYISTWGSHLQSQAVTFSSIL